MLEGNREKIFGLENNFFLVRRPGFDFDFCRTFYFCGVIDHTQTPFFPQDFSLTGSDNWIDKFDEIFPRLFMIGVEHDNALRNTKLNGRESDAGGVVHRLHHVID